MQNNYHQLKGCNVNMDLRFCFVSMLTEAIICYVCGHWNCMSHTFPVWFVKLVTMESFMEQLKTKATVPVWKIWPTSALFRPVRPEWSVIKYRCTQEGSRSSRSDRPDHIRRYSGPHMTTFSYCVHVCVLGHIEGSPTQLTASTKSLPVGLKSRRDRSLSGLLKPRLHSRSCQSPR